MPLVMKKNLLELKNRMTENHNITLVDNSSKLVKVNLKGITDTSNFKFSFYSCDAETGDINLNEDLNLEQTKKLFEALKLLDGDNQSEEKLQGFIRQFASIEDITTTKSFFEKLGSEKINHIKENLNDIELENLGASIKQTLYKKEIDNLKCLIEIDKNFPKRPKFFEKVKENNSLNKYLFDETEKETKQQEKVFENWLRKNLWVLEIEFFEDLKIKDLSKYIPGGKNVLPDLVFKNKNCFLNLIELKRPHEKLFNYDKSHSTYYKHPNLAKAKAQCIKYLKKIEEANREKFLKDLRTEILRPNIKLIYGSFSESKKEELEELRSINFHANCIEIITYNDLIEMGENILNNFN